MEYDKSELRFSIMDFEKIIEWYNQNAEQYSKRVQGITFEDVARVFLSDLGDNPKILEAGCGDGRDASTLHDQGAIVTGIDFSEGLIKIAKSTYPEIEFHHGSFLDLPFQNEYFDGVWSHASLVHLEKNEDVTCALQEFHRVLRKGGRLYIAVKEQNGDETTAVVSDSLSQHDRFFRYYKQEDLQNMLTEIGFKIESMAIEEDKHGRSEVSWIKLFAQKI